MSNIIDLTKLNSADNKQVEQLLKMCAASNKCLDFHDSLSETVIGSSNDELSYEELENAAGGLNTQSIKVPPLQLE